MKSVLKYMLLEEFQREPLNEMANAPKSVTGLPVIVWIEAEEPMRHNTPRIKFQNSYSNKLSHKELVPLTIEDNPIVPIKNWNGLNISQKDFERIRKWVIRNKELLLKYWKYKITSYEVFQQNSKDTEK